jgi:glutamyl-tRNA reductase
MKSNESHFTVYTYQFFLTINSLNLHPDIMAAKLNTYQTSQFTVLSISFEKADAVTRGRFAFFDDHIKSFVNHIHDREMGDALSFPHVIEPKFIPQHIIICLWLSYFVKPLVYN